MEHLGTITCIHILGTTLLHIWVYYLNALGKHAHTSTASFPGHSIAVSAAKLNSWEWPSDETNVFTDHACSLAAHAM